MLKRTAHTSSIEALEARIAPATLNFAANGTVTYTAGAGIANFLTLTITGSSYRFDDVENITVTGFGSATGSGTSVVDLNVSGITSLVFNLGDQNDTLLIRNLQHPLTVNDGAGNDTVRFETNQLTPTASVSVAAETVNIDSSLSIGGFNSATFTADNVAIGASGTVSAQQKVTFTPLTPGRGINLGTENGAQLSLTDAELDRVSTFRLQIGAADSGSIELSAAMTPTNSSITTINTGADVLTTGGGAWSGSALAVTAAGNVALTGPNALNGFSMSATGSGTSTFNEVDGFSITSTYSVAGISNPNGTTQIITPGSVLSAHPIITPNLRLAGGGSFALSAVTNTIGTLAANTTHEVLVRNSSLLTIGTVGGTTGVTAGTVEFTAPDMAINAPINVGTGDAYFFPSNSAFIVDLASSGGANTFALSIAELGSITAGKFFIGSDANAMNIGNVFALSGSLKLTASSVSGSGGIVVPTLTISSPNIQLGGSNNVSTLILDGSLQITAFTFNGGDNFTIRAVNVDTPLSFPATSGANLSLPNGIITLGPDAQFLLGIGAAGVAQIAVSGEVTLNTQLRFNQTSALPFGTTFHVLVNDGSDAINGTFNGLPEGALVPGITPPARISYIGGDGNDVTIRTAEALDVDIATDGKSATFRDVDGDLVSVKTTAGTFTQASFSGYQTGVIGGGQLQKLTLDATFTGANITFTAKPTPLLGGNGFVNIGLIDATGVDLGAVTIPGDLGRIAAGTPGGSAKVPGIKSLTVESFGLLGTSTQASGGSNIADIQGALAALTVKSDLRAEMNIAGQDGLLGKATIGGSIVGTGNISAAAGIGSLTVGGDIRSVGGTLFIVSDDGAIGSVTVGGSIVGETPARPVHIGAFGQHTAPAKGVDIAIKSITVKGSVENGNFGAGTTGLNADASIGSITVSGDWIASLAVAGTSSGADFSTGTNDDEKLVGRDNPNIQSSIGSFTVKGQAFGTASTTTDMFGIVAEQIGKAKVGARTFAFKAGATKEAFFAAPTLTGAGTESPMFDFTIRELGSTTPSITTATPNLVISTDGKTATFVDVDGDLVTVKRTAGAFSMGEFQITPTAALGGLFAKLTLTAAPKNALFNVTISAKVGPTGGNGFVNVGEIDADGIDVGAITVGGELQGLEVGNNDDTVKALGSLTVQSLGEVGGTSQFGDEINGEHGLGSITVKTDIRGTSIFSNHQDSGNLSSLTVGGSVSRATIQSAAGIGSITIGGSFRDGGRIQAVNRVSAVSIGGDLSGTIVEIFGDSANGAKGPDLLLKTLTVGGNVEKTNVILGRNNNADASIASVSVGREWLASSILSGIDKGTDGFAGTQDDIKVALGGPIDGAARLSTIASILIKGQALGTPATGDHFGIVAEVIGKAKIGSVSYGFKPTTNELFAAAPTGPGKGLSPFETFDFYIREL